MGGVGARAALDTRAWGQSRSMTGRRYSLQDEIYIYMYMYTYNGIVRHRVWSVSCICITFVGNIARLDCRKDALDVVSAAFIRPVSELSTVDGSTEASLRNC